MLINQSPKSNPTPTWLKTIREFIFLGIIPAAIYTTLYCVGSTNIYLELLQLVSLLVALRGTFLFIIKIIRMNVEDWKK